MPAASLLPLFGSAAGPGTLGGPAGSGAGGGGRKAAGPGAFRLTEKFVLLLVFSAFITLCFGAIFFLPDSSKLLSGVFFHSAALQPPPPPPGGQPRAPPQPGGGPAAAAAAAGGAGSLERIRADHERALREAKETLQKLPEEIRRDIRQDKEKLLQDARGRKEAGAPGLPQRLFRQPVGAVGQEPTDPDVRQKREKIKEVSGGGCRSRSAGCASTPPRGATGRCRVWRRCRGTPDPSCRLLPAGRGSFWPPVARQPPRRSAASPAVASSQPAVRSACGLRAGCSSLPPCRRCRVPPDVAPKPGEKAKPGEGWQAMGRFGLGTAAPGRNSGAGPPALPVGHPGLGR